MLVVVFSGCDLFKSEDTEIKDYTVTYRVYGTHVSATTITYKNASGIDSTFSVTSTPWQYTFTASTGTSVYLYAKKEGGSHGQGLSISIDLDGEAWKSGYCSSTFCSISKEGSLP